LLKPVPHAPLAAGVVACHAVEEGRLPAAVKIDDVIWRRPQAGRESGREDRL